MTSVKVKLRTGKIEEIAFTNGGAGNQWTTIGGTRYATWWDISRKDWKVGDMVTFQAYQTPLWYGQIPIDCARNICKAEVN